MTQRIVTGLILIAACAVLLALGGVVLSAAVVIIVCFAVHEEYRALEQAGATFEDETSADLSNRQPVTKADFFELGLSGGAEASARRKVLLKRLEFPERMTANALLEAVNVLYTREEFLKLAGETLSRR